MDNFALLPLMGVVSSRPILAALLGAIIWLFNNHYKLEPYLDWASKLVSWIPIAHSKKLVLEGRISYSRSSTFCHMTNEMKGIMYHMHENLDTIGSVHNVQSIDFMSSSDRGRKTLNTPIQSRNVYLSNGIRVTVMKREEEQKGDQSFYGPVNITRVEMTISSNALSYTQMTNFIKKCADDYERIIQNKAGTHMIFEYRCNDDDDVPIFDETPFVSNKTFDNLFFEGKDEIVKRLVHFESDQGRIKSNMLGIQHSLGFMFYGEAGCGKTSAIKAIANLTKRHVVVIRMDRIIRQNPDKCVDVLKAIMQSPKIGDLVVPHKQRLWVFEETDCWQNILQQRSSQPHKKPADGKKEDATNALLLEMLHQASAPVAPQQPVSQLGGLLELLDGIVEMPDRLIVMTTNHPEKMDNALIRPGRIDVKHEFKKLPRQEVSNLYKLWYGSNLPPHVLESLHDYQFTQAELAQRFAVCDAKTAIISIT